jgi:uncharacterized membrane protein YeaQ/YmgE (transglycosylase-associated protein family)
MMNGALWIVAGSIIGWIAFEMVRSNQRLGLFLPVLIGAVGAYFGGDVVAPMFAAAVQSTGFSPFALIVAMASAVGSLTIDNVMFER